MTVSARATLLAISVSAALLFSAAIKQPIRKPTFDPSLPVVELFDAIDRDLVDVTVIARNAHDANLFLRNKSPSPVSVQLPKVVGAVHVLKQLGPPPGNNGASNGFGASTASGNGNNGQGQTVGGGVPNNSKTASGNFNSLPGGAFFSIPSEKTIQLPLKTVCLAHGRPDPQPKMQYRLVRIDEVARDAELRTTLARYVAGEVDQQVTQAVAWHLCDGLSWKSLAEKQVGQIGGLPGKPLFTAKQIDAARQLVEQIREETARVSSNATREVSSRTKE